MSLNIKKQPAWLQLVIFGLITLVLAVVGSLVGLMIVGSVNHLGLRELAHLTPADFAKPEYASVAKGLLVVQFFAIFFLPSLLFAVLADSKPLAFAGLKKPDHLSFILLGVLVLLCSFFMVSWLGEVNVYVVKNFLGKAARSWVEKSESDIDGTLENVLNMKNATDLLVDLVLVGVLAAIGEELFFRGIIQRIMIQAFKSPWVGIIVTAAIFSAIHGQFLGFLPRMILGIILGALYWYSGSLYPCIAGHFVYNGLQVLLVYFKVIDTKSNGVSGLYLALVGALATVVIIYLMNRLRKNSTTTYEKVYAVAPPEMMEL